MPETDPNPFAEGCPVIIAYNPHHDAGTGVLGRVVKFEAGTGFMGCDLAARELPPELVVAVLPMCPVRPVTPRCGSREGRRTKHKEFCPIC